MTGLIAVILTIGAVFTAINVLFLYQNVRFSRGLDFGQGYVARPGVIVIDGESKILEWDHFSERIFGWTAKEALGNNLSIIMPEEMQAPHLMAIERYKHTGVGQNLNKLLLLPGRNKEGKIFHIQLLAFTSKNRKTGEVVYVGLIWNAVDIESH